MGGVRVCCFVVFSLLIGYLPQCFGKLFNILLKIRLVFFFKIVFVFLLFIISWDYAFGGYAYLFKEPGICGFISC